MAANIESSLHKLLVGLESSDHRMMPPQKLNACPLHIKVRLGKATAASEDRVPEHNSRGVDGATASQSKALATSIQPGNSSGASILIASKPRVIAASSTFVGNGATNSNNASEILPSRAGLNGNTSSTSNSAINHNIGNDNWPDSIDNIHRNLVSSSATLSTTMSSGLPHTAATPIGGYVNNIYHQSNQISPNAVSSFAQTQPSHTSNEQQQ